MLDLRHLRHLLALSKHGNFSRAAEALHITQPALSRSIQSIEELVGQPLFDRTREGINPTDMGRLLLRHAISLDISSLELDREIRLAKGLELGELTIGVGPFGGSVLVGPVIGRLNRLHPRLRIRLVVAPWIELPERARAREVDMVLAEISEIELLDDFELLTLTRQPTVVVARAEHPLCQLEMPSYSDLFNYPLAGPRLPAKAMDALLNVAPKNLLSSLETLGLLTIECDSSSILKKILIESDAVSMLPRFIAEAEIRTKQLVILDRIPLAISSCFGAGWIRHRSRSSAGLKFLELLQEYDQQLSNARVDAS